MSATATEAGRGWTGAGGTSPWRCWPGLLGLALLLWGCAEAPLPEQGLRRDDCLRELSLENLQERLRTCHAVVAAFPQHPGPLNDRYLLHSLAGDDRAACADLGKAVTLARAIPAAQLDEQLRIDLKVRESLCKESGKQGPAGAR
jgi:hypothetical protein